MTAMTASTFPAPIDPLRAHPGGRYSDERVVVARRAGSRLCGSERPVGRTADFTVGRDGHRLVLVHDLPDHLIDNDLAGLLVEQLFRPGWVAGAETFERLFTGVVLSCADDPLQAWELFYRNSLRVMDGGSTRPAGDGGLGQFATIYRHLEHLLQQAGATSLIDLGACFGLFALRVAGGSAGPVGQVFACDITSGSMTLLRMMAQRLQRPLRTLVCDAARVPLADRSVDVVTAIHLLEHVDHAHAERIVAEATRLARHRVVVTVPLEPTPDLTFGHVQALDLAGLRRFGTEHLRQGWRSRVEEFHGGWLVLDRAAPAPTGVDPGSP